MKKLLLASVAFTALMAASATAAPVYRRPVAVTPVYSWTGFYAGVNVGYGWGRSDPSDPGTGTLTTILGGNTQIPNPPLAFGGGQDQKLNGVIGGGQIGYNYQFNRFWIVGLEADIQAAGQQNNKTFVDPIAGAFCSSGNAILCQTAPSTHTTPFSGTAVTAYQARLDWFGTVRGRVGWLVTDQTFLYATGGLAYGHFGVSGVANVSGTLAPLPVNVTFIGGTGGFGDTQTIGYAVGGGIEGKCRYLLPQNWSWKVEYLYLDLGSFNASVPFAASSSRPGSFSNFVGTINYHSQFTDNIVRVGLNYKFGNYYAPVVTR
jgi:outer membrane immunogenic protein